MNIAACKRYRFAFGKFVSTTTDKEYTFSIHEDDRFYVYMKKHIIKGKVEGLTHETIDSIFIEDTDHTFFNEKSFTLIAYMLVTDANDIVNSYIMTIPKVRLIANSSSTKSFENNRWTLELYSLGIPYQTNINIEETID